MKSLAALLFASSLCFQSTSVTADTFGSGDNRFEIVFVTIGHPRNSSDRGSRNGRVEHVYRMGKFEVSREMVLKVNAEGKLNIKLADMTRFGGNRSLAPATGVSWNHAACFVNWLNTSSGFEPAYKVNARQTLDYQVKAKDAFKYNDAFVPWDSTEAGFDPSHPLRNGKAKYFLPTVDEWYKAAYYDAQADSGKGGYWRYPTGSNSPPRAVRFGTALNTAVYGQKPEIGPADINNAGGTNPNGVVAMGGNVFELAELKDRVQFWGGHWWFGERDAMTRNNRGSISRASASTYVGFRVASRVAQSDLSTAD